MPRIVVAGGGLIGMAAAMMFAQDGAEVIVLERDDDAVPGSPGTAWQDWDRRGIAQFRAFMEIISMLALPGDIMARPGFSEHLAKPAAGHEAFEMPGPSRADLLRSLA
jgi:2-polyprenyl-6-methoxyphenol hydroxylase-like FAD-dependent oxidoreductase